MICARLDAEAMFFISCLMFLSLGNASELSLADTAPATLQLAPTLVEHSPGSESESKVKCERVLIRGLSRIKYMNKFAKSMRVEVSQATRSGRRAIIDICFHENASLEIGTCHQDRWEKLANGLWIKSTTPFDHKVLDIRMGGSCLESLQVSLREEFSSYRMLFLVSGVVLMSLSSVLSNSLCFYRISAIVAGVFLVVLLGLFQAVRFLPDGPDDMLSICLYFFIVSYGTLQLVEVGLPSDTYDPLPSLLIVFVVIAGAGLAFWGVNNLVRKKDGSIDVDVSLFFTWSFRAVASVLILQTCIDPLFAIGVLIAVVFMPMLARHVYRKLVTRKQGTLPSEPTCKAVSELVLTDEFRDRLARKSISRKKKDQ